MLRKIVVIRNVKDKKEFFEENFSILVIFIFVSRFKVVGFVRRIFFYVFLEGDNVVVRRRLDRVFKELKGIRKFYCVKIIFE